MKEVKEVKEVKELIQILPRTPSPFFKCVEGLPVWTCLLVTIRGIPASLDLVKLSLKRVVCRRKYDTLLT